MLETMTDTSKLCERCQQINFPAIFDPRRVLPPSDGLLVFELEHLRPHPNCVVCHLLLTVAVQDDEASTKDYHIRVLPAAKLFETKELVRHTGSAIALSVLPGRKRGAMLPWMRQAYRDRGFVLARHLEPRLESCLSMKGAVVDPSQTNFDRLSSWLQACDASHAYSCGPRAISRPLSVPLHCIDCETRQIQSIRNEDSYLALSYVWGGSRLPERGAAPNVVPSRASQVVEDAINVVRNLGKRFLWIDQYCIDQSNHDIRNAQIAEMDRVYAGAYATIVAAAGSDTDYGLPGVSRRRLEQQHVVNLGHIELMSSMPSFAYAMNNTTWITRGWTYQEASLSQRCIFFTEYQVYFVCQVMIHSEAVMQEVLTTAQPEKPGKYTGPASLPKFLSPNLEKKGSSFFGTLVDHIAEYSCRSLTFEEDRLDAFRGILSRSPFYTFFGVPVACNDDEIAIMNNKDFNIGFARGLCWAPGIAGTKGYSVLQQGFSRRSRFPSWSWAGWKGSVDYRNRNGLQITPTGRFSSVTTSNFDTQFFLQDAHGHLITLYEAAQSLADTKILPELQYSLFVEARVYRLHFRLYVVDPVPFHHGTRYMQIESVQGLDLRDSSKNTVLYDTPETAIFSQYLTAWSSDLPEESVSKDFDCVFLFQDNLQPSYSHLLVIEWEGEVARRVGNLSVSNTIAVGFPVDFDIFAAIPIVKKRFRMV